MKFLVFSDSHGRVDNMMKALIRNKDADMVIHLGDSAGDALRLKELCGNINLEYVCGNNDWVRDCPFEKLFVLEGKRILITHGHKYGVKTGYSNIIEKGKAAKAEVVFFGHTHKVAEIFSDGMQLINPGSIGRPVWPDGPTYCVAEAGEGKFKTRFMGVK